MSTSTLSAPITLVGQIEAQQTALGLSDHDLCRAVGFEREIFLTLIKAGTMKLPLNKVPVLATALGLDPVELLKVALGESDPALSQLIGDLFDPLRLTSTEVNLIKHVRKLSGEGPGAPIVFEGKGVIALVTV